MKLFTSLKPRPTARQKLRAAVARRATRTPSIEDEEEPTTSFKTALIVVVLLHLVAAGGVYMFDSIKTHRPSVSEQTSTKAKKTAASEAAASGNAAAVAAAAQGTTAAARPKASAAPSSTPAEIIKKTATASAVATADVRDSGQTYTIAKGDTLVSISKKLHVVYDDICKLNKIEDPKKLRIGQKLHIPAKPRASSN